MRFRLRFYFILFVLSRLEFDTFFPLYDDFVLHLIEFRNFYCKLRAQNWICVDYNQTINVNDMNTTTTTTTPTTIMQQKTPNKPALCLN